MKSKKIPNWAIAGHKQPKTRREFLAHGLIPFIASTFLPNPLKLFQNPYFLDSAWANATCNTGASNQWIPVIQIDLAGGPALMANFVPRDEGGQFLASYNRMGLGLQPPTEQVFGGATWYTNSGMLAGIRTQLQNANNIMNRIRMFGVCVRSRDDTSANAMATNGVLQKIGINGSFLPHMGNQNSATVGRHQPALLKVSGPLFVNNFNAISSSLSLTGALGNLSNTQRTKLARLAQTLNQSQARKLSQESNIKAIEHFVSCASVKNSEILEQSTSFVDPRTNPNLQTIWGINNNTAANAQNLVFASLVYNTLQGHSGSSTITLGGYDYHGQTRAATDALDNTVGQLIGRIMLSAQALNRPVFLIVTSDGSVGSVQSDTPGSNFNSDRGDAGMMYAFIYDPNRSITLRNTQLGHFGPGQDAVVQNSVVGASTERAIGAILINYLALQNRVGELERVLGRSMFSMTELNQIILIS